jgi:hypothetical protein
MTTIVELFLNSHLHRAHLAVAEDGVFAPSAEVDDQHPRRALLGERTISGMARCGVECAVMSPSTYFCAKTASAKRHFPIPDHRGIWLGTMFVRHRLEDAIREWRPQLVLPLDDISAWLLRGLAVSPTVSPALRKVLVESLGRQKAIPLP